MVDTDLSGVLTKLLVGALILTLPLTTVLHPIRHVDPAGLRDEYPLPASLYLFYLRMVDFMVVERWDEALSQLKHSPHIFVPSDLQFIFQRFNNLLNDTRRDLEEARRHIDNASSLIDRAALSDAELELDRAKTLLLKANSTLFKLERAARHLASLLRASPKPLLNMIDKLRGLISKYLDEIDELFAKIYRYQPTPTKPLIRTILTIEVKTTIVTVGDSVDVWGCLTTDSNTPLPSRIVNIFFDNDKIGESVTLSNGSYHFKFNIPYIYKDRVVLCAVYLPRGVDEGRFRPSSSRIIILNIMFEKPRLDAEVPNLVLPSLNFTVNGRLSLHGKGLNEYLVLISWLGRTITAITDVNGVFTAELSVPPDAPTGVYRIMVKARPKGIIGPASTILTTKVVRVPVNVEVEPPIASLAGAVTIFRGRVSVDGEPLPYANVHIKVGDWSSVTFTGSGGEFTALLNIPPSASTQSYDYIVSVAPSVAWALPVKQVGSVFILNLFTVEAIGITGFVVAAMLVRRREEGVKVIEVPMQVEERRLIPHRVVGGIADLYWRVVGLISKYTGVEMRSNYTVREYVELVRERLKVDVYSAFRDLSLIYEKHLYGEKLTGMEEEYALQYYNELLRMMG